MPDADSAERGSAVTAAEAAGETAPRRDREGRNRRFCSTWTLNAVAAAMHAAWFVIFVLLWALDENEDGSKRDVTYPLFYTSARFGKPPDPPTTPAESLVLDASVSTELGSTTPINPFPSCDAPRDARVGTMPVSPAFRDSHLVMSLHWLVSSFFALSFLFQAAAAVADARRVGFFQKLDSGKKNDDDVSASLVAGGALRGNDHVTTPHRAAMASWLRFVEYSFSAAVMVVAIALQVGLMDAWMLFALAALTWTTMMLGLLGERVLAAEERVVAAGARAERWSQRERRGDDESETNDTTPSSVSSQARDDPRRAMRSETAAVAAALRVVRWTAHLTGWVSQGVVFVVIVAHFFASQRACEWEDSTEEGNRREDNVAPDFVYAIVFAELALFVGFGATQFAQFAQFDRDVYAERRRRRGICGNCGNCGKKNCGAKRRERRRGSEKKETTRRAKTRTKPTKPRVAFAAPPPRPRGTTAPRAPARWRVLRRRTSCNRS